MKNIDKKPTYYVSLTEYNEVKRMFLKANDEINTLKELLKECRSPINYALCLNLSKEEKIEFKNLLAKIKQVLGEE